MNHRHVLKGNIEGCNINEHNEFEYDYTLFILHNITLSLLVLLLVCPEYVQND